MDADSVAGPPFLVIRPGLAFWVQHDELERASATLQSFRAGCFEGAHCYDGAGVAWPIVRAELTRRPGIFQRAVPSLRLPVRLHLGPPQRVSLEEIVQELSAVLRSGNDFCDQLRKPPDELLSLFEEANSVEELIRLVEKYCS